MVSASSVSLMVSASSPPLPKEAPLEGEYEEGPRREAKWWYSTFHTVTAMVGAGVLSLPYAIAYLGWYCFLFLVLSRMSLFESSFMSNQITWLA
ncbi:Amino acid transporter, transmembrane [Cynara cardunculus var. scolymus]|uniref:Amino acid transporter, transmembrane n=1 Tax=Cynara cardunculus var. scolymus TaxID=59895 RepID=A0A118JYJ9_CYNCS|nr:Amino acid transporter, transmembrane [Cynara cardunculus var. scolymus]